LTGFASSGAVCGENTTIIHDYARLSAIEPPVVCGAAYLGTTTIGWNDPLSLALSPLRGARVLANRGLVVARCAQVEDDSRSRTGDPAIFCHFLHFVTKNIFFTFIDLH
jgi:hypothetical protein